MAMRFGPLGAEPMNHVPAPITENDRLLSQLEALVGTDALITDLAQRTFYSTDIAETGRIAAAVVRVRETELLSRVVAACTGAGFTVIPRGGGFSYTGGYTPEQQHSVIIDLRPMDRIVEINVQDMYVVVETGCTWRLLYQALQAKGVRTPYFGPMSGYHATIGGALSQGSFFLGSSQYGPVSESVLGLEVVLADGTVLRTGSGASTEFTPPFLRQYGPDATGFFLNDSGAMGLKTRAVLRLIQSPPYQAYGSFAFASHAAALAAVSEIGRSGLAAECYCWDPFFVRLMAAASTGTAQDLRFLLNVVKAGSGLIDGLTAAARIALAGRRDMRGDGWLLHTTIDDVSAAGAAAKLRLVRDLAKAQGGREVSPSAPRAMRGTPFIDFNIPERRIPRRNLPVHGIAPHSRAPAVADEIYAFLERHQNMMQREGVQCGVIFFAVLGQAAAIEPLLYWDDPEHLLHDRIAQTSDLAQLATRSERSAATRLAFDLRDGLKQIFRRHGCVHLQIGRAYPWRDTRDPATLRLLAAVKHAVDPRGLMNRGALGFAGPKLDAP
jgi:FAD/FMN-containing dehydrogenase